MWTDITRAHHARDGLRLPSDLTDRVWALIAPHLPPRSRLGRPARWSLRRIMEALLFLLRGGLPWRMLPPRIFPPPTTVQHYFYAWRDAGIWPSINHALVMAAREQIGRGASPTAGVIDSQSVKTTQSGGIRGYDAGKKLVGRKRHIVTDTQGFMVGAVIHAAKGFEVIARRWVVERTFAWLARNRRLARDFERSIESAAAWLFIATVQLLARRIASH